MKIHTVFITHNRLEFTKRAIASYLETVTVPATYSVVDNASTDGTAEWLHENWVSQEYGNTFRSYVVLAENRYPGFAANHGWAIGPSDATHLHRADNDFTFLPGWCKHVQRCFLRRNLGQLGMRTSHEEHYAPYNVGGNCIILRELWDKGLRYDERPWPQIREEEGKGHSEDSFLSPAVMAMGYKWGRVNRPCISSMLPDDLDDPAYDDPYYTQSFGDRGIR